MSVEGEPLVAELRTAMDTKSILTIPVLVGGADMPKASTLPEGLKDFADHRGVPIYPQYVDAGLTTLQERLGRHVPVEMSKPSPKASGSFWIGPKQSFAIIAAIAIAALVFSFVDPTDPDPTPEPEPLKLDQADMLALTLQYRFEDYSDAVKEGLASVVMNRVRDAEFPNSVDAVLRQPKHFPLWENSKAEIAEIWAKAQASQEFASVRTIAERAVAGRSSDKTKGATRAAPCASVPDWLKTAEYARSARIESMCFFIETDQSDTPVEDPIWMPFLQEQAEDWKTRLIDETTRAGAKRVGEYFEAAGLPANTDATTTGWSAAFVAYVMEKHGFSAPRNASKADSWLTFDLPLRVPRPGAIVLLRSRSSGAAQHIGFYTGTNADGSKIRVIGGNQGNSVSEISVAAANVLGYRWPIEAE